MAKQIILKSADKSLSLRCDDGWCKCYFDDHYLGANRLESILQALRDVLQPGAQAYIKSKHKPQWGYDGPVITLADGHASIYVRYDSSGDLELGIHDKDNEKITSLLLNPSSQNEWLLRLK